MTTIQVSDGRTVEIEIGDFIVATQSKAREDWDWGEVVAVDGEAVTVAWSGSASTTTQPAGALAGSDLYTGADAAREAFEAARKFYPTAAAAFDAVAVPLVGSRAAVAEVLGITRSAYGDAVNGRREGMAAFDWMKRWQDARGETIVVDWHPDLGFRAELLVTGIDVVGG